MNLLGVILSTLYLVMKYPLDNGKVGTIKGDQEIARKCYHKNLRMQKETKPQDVTTYHSVNMIDLNPREEYQKSLFINFVKSATTKPNIFPSNTNPNFFRFCYFYVLLHPSNILTSNKFYY
jgi:hypothetical protein